MSGRIIRPGQINQRPASAGGIISEPELVECSVMRCSATGGWGVARAGGRYVCALPAGYNSEVGIIPQDGRLIVTMPGKPKLVCDPMTGQCRKAH